MSAYTTIDVTRTLFPVADFLASQRSGALELRPPFQRGSVWKPNARSFFVDTVVRGYPVPTILLQDDLDRASQKIRSSKGSLPFDCYRSRMTHSPVSTSKAHRAS